MGVAEVKYKVGKWTKPNEGCGPLAVFKTFEDALEFNSSSMADLHKCLWEESSDDGLWYISNGRVYCADLDLPKGTGFASRVMIVD